MTDEVLIEALSFPVYRRVSTVIFVPAQSHPASSVEMVTIESPPMAYPFVDLQAALDRDASAPMTDRQSISYAK
jgi:hypothetical protein